jgi:hypothetical protein
MVNLFFKGHIKDIMTGYRAFSFQFAKSFPVLSKGFEIETEMSIHALNNNFSLKSISVNYRDRPEGSVSKLNTVKDGIKVLKTIFRLCKDFRPYAFFGGISLLLVVFSVLMMIPIFVEFFQTGLVPKFPTLIIACFVALSALQCYICGLILDTESKMHKQDFEVQQNIIFMMKTMLERDNKECEKHLNNPTPQKLGKEIQGNDM